MFRFCLEIPIVLGWGIFEVRPESRKSWRLMKSQISGFGEAGSSLILLSRIRFTRAPPDQTRIPPSFFYEMPGYTNYQKYTLKKDTQLSFIIPNFNYAYSWEQKKSALSFPFSYLCKENWKLLHAWFQKVENLSTKKNSRTFEKFKFQVTVRCLGATKFLVQIR